MTESISVAREQVEATVASIHFAGLMLIEAQPHVTWKLKEDGTFITELDLKVQEYLRTRLERIFPGWVLIAEEDSGSFGLAVEARPRMVLDPIDGTAPFGRGLGHYGMSFAIVDSRSQPVLAVIHLPLLGRWRVASFADRRPTWYGVSVDTGVPRVWVDEAPRGALTGWNLRDAYIYVSSDAHLQVDLSAYEGKIRALGATAAHLTLLLDGTIDPLAVVLTRFKLWDVAAGLALAAGAGFTIQDLSSPSVPLDLAEVFQSIEARPLMVGRPEVLGALAGQVKLLGGR